MLKILVCFFTANLLFSATARADSTNFPTAKLSVIQSLYSGDKGTSLGEAGSGYGVELENSTVYNRFFSFYLKVRGNTSSGTQNFYDGTTLVSSPFSFYQGQTELGVYFFPIQREHKGLNVFFGGGGIAGYNYISLSKATTLTTTPHSSQGIGTGFSGTLGGEYILRTMNRAWSLQGQLSYRSEKCKLLDQKDFDLSAIVLGLGIGF